MKAKLELDPGRFFPEKRWPYSDERKAKKAGGNLDALQTNGVFINWLAGWTPRQIIEAIASQSRPPIPIDSLDKCLDQPPMPNGGRIEGYTADRIDAIVSNYQGRLRWWMSRKGLVIASVGATINRLSFFNLRAGKLMMEHCPSRKLTKPALAKIAVALDRAGFKLEDNLQPAHWQQIRDHNEKPNDYAAFQPVDTFQRAVRTKEFARFVCKKLYYARDRYKRSAQRGIRV